MAVSIKQIQLKVLKKMRQARRFKQGDLVIYTQKLLNLENSTKDHLFERRGVFFNYKDGMDQICYVLFDEFSLGSGLIQVEEAGLEKTGN
jgi:hypothetical protein